MERTAFLSKEADVVVIGAGPAGSSAAAEMAKEGLNVLLVEKDEFPGKNNVCAGGIAKTSVRDLDLEPAVIEKEIFGSLFFFPWEAIEDRRVVAQSISVQRMIFDNYLARRAVRLGAKLSCFTLATGVTTATNGVDVYLRDMRTGRQMIMNTDLVIFADGPSTLANKRYGLGFLRSPDRTFIAAIYEFEWKNTPLDCFEFFFDRNVSPWGYGWIFPKRHIVNVGVGCLLSKLRTNIRQNLDYLVNKHPIASEKLRDRKILRFASALIPVAPARNIVGPRMLVVGDAAGIVDPLWGGGIGYAIHTGRIAGQIAVKSFEESDFSKDSLQHQWTKEFERTKENRNLQYQFVKSRIMLALSSFDQDAYIRLQGLFTRITQSKPGRMLLREPNHVI